MINQPRLLIPSSFFVSFLHFGERQSVNREMILEFRIIVIIIVVVIFFIILLVIIIIIITLLLIMIINNNNIVISLVIILLSYKSRTTCMLFVAIFAWLCLV